MHAILVDVTHYGLKVIAKYQSSTKDLPAHKIQKKWTIFQVKLHLVKQFSIFEIAWQWQLFEFERSILNTMIVWFARHLAIQDVYKTLAEFVFLLWIMTHCNPCLAKTGQGSLYLFVSTKSSKNEYTGTDEYYSEWITASS